MPIAAALLVAASLGAAVARAGAGEGPFAGSAAIVAPPGGPELLEAVAEGEIALPLERVRAVLLDLEAFPRWFPALAEWRVLARSSSAARVYGRQALPWPVQDRDYVVDYRWWDGPGAAFSLEARARADAPPPSDGVVRLDLLRSRWTILEAGDATRVRYEVELIPRGAVPRWIEDASWRSSGYRLVDALAAEVRARGAD